MEEAAYWHALANGDAQCDLCPHHCVIREAGSGRCRVRSVHDGRLRAAGYGRVSAMHLDPIEKKPLYHFAPGSEILSIGGWGCNLVCAFCQNWTISQRVEEGADRWTPARIVERALCERSAGIAYTYNEPLINMEFVLACARAARERGLYNVLVTNGFVEAAPAGALLPWIDALNIDIKSMSDSYYRRHCGGSLYPVLRFAEQAAAAGCHVEITNLVIPGLNDAPERLAELVVWIRKKLGASVPLHLSAYHPQYKMNVPATQAEVLEQARGICRQELSYVYLGNIVATSGQNTDCPQCGNLLVSRRGYATRMLGIRKGVCARCGRKADFVQV